MNDLDDLSICKRIAEIEGFEFEVKSLTSITPEGVWPSVPFKSVGMSIGGSAYNPLTDDALCFKLMVKNRITFSTYEKRTGKNSYADAFSAWDGDDKYLNFQIDISPNKAICLAIIEAHKE